MYISTHIFIYTSQYICIYLYIYIHRYTYMFWGPLCRAGPGPGPGPGPGEDPGWRDRGRDPGRVGPGLIHGPKLTLGPNLIVKRGHHRGIGGQYNCPIGP